MSDPTERPVLAPHDELHDIASGLRAWLEWQAMTGSLELPADPTPVVVAAPPPPPRTAPARATTAPRAPAAPRPAGPSAQAAASDRSQAPSARPAAGSGTVGAPPTTPVGKGADGLRQVRDELGDCQRCALATGRKHLVFGVGSPQAELVLIGEAPGQQEDATGEPFVGRSGQLLTRMLASIGLERSDVYICNVIKCRPPGNRDPLPGEIATCSPFLHRQVRAIGPKVILTLGRFAGVNIIGRQATMGELRKDTSSFLGTPVVATFHPSYLLRTPSAKRQAWDDLLRVRRLLSGG
ncbi:MAG: uracil-DNA glycosylase [Myxococcota bacterium]